MNLNYVMLKYFKPEYFLNHFDLIRVCLGMCFVFFCVFYFILCFMGSLVFKNYVDLFYSIFNIWCSK